MESLSVLVIVIMSSLVLIKSGGKELNNHFKVCDIPAIYNFGDSNSDTGGLAAALFQLVPPYGESFSDGPPSRLSDGRLIIDFIAEQLGLPYLSAYLDSIHTNFQHGANFATGGATIRRPKGSWLETYLSPFPLDIQVRHYNKFKERSVYFYNKAKEPSDRTNLPGPEGFSKALYTIDIGQNDFGDLLQLENWEQIQATVSDIVNQSAKSVQELYENGARAFWIHNTGPFGCLPTSLRDFPGYLDENGCVKHLNDISQEFNNQLKQKISQLRGELPQAALTYVDIYTAKYYLISNAKSQGFKDPFKMCCGYNEDGTSIDCGGKAVINGTEVFAGSCEDPSAFISWDGTHYSEAANSWVVNRIMDGSLSDPPIPITQACHKYVQSMLFGSNHAELT